MGFQAGDEAGIPGADKWQRREEPRLGWTLPGRSATLSGRRQTGSLGFGEHQVVADNCPELDFNMGGSPQAQKGKRLWTLWETAFDNSLVGHEGDTAIHSDYSSHPTLKCHLVVNPH